MADCRPSRAGVALAIALLLGGHIVRADDSRSAWHRRITTKHGPVHVWLPRGYDAESAGIVVFVHGYFTGVDDAWRTYHLAHQFAESGINALFIACEAPEGPTDPVSWTSVRELLDQVEIRLHERLPRGPVFAVGHSGAHRTLSTWVGEDVLDTIGLLDALYGELPEIRSWIDGSPDRRLIDVGEITRPWADRLHAALPETKVFEDFPPPDRGHLEGARAARIVYVRSQLGHMPLITGGVALPMVLRASRIASLPDASRKAPIRGITRRRRPPGRHRGGTHRVDVVARPHAQRVPGPPSTCALDEAKVPELLN